MHKLKKRKGALESAAPKGKLTSLAEIKKQRVCRGKKPEDSKSEGKTEQ